MESNSYKQWLPIDLDTRESSEVSLPHTKILYLNSCWWKAFYPQKQGTQHNINLGF